MYVCETVGLMVFFFLKFWIDRWFFWTFEPLNCKIVSLEILKKSKKKRGKIEHNTVKKEKKSLKICKKKSEKIKKYI